MPAYISTRKTRGYPALRIFVITKKSLIIAGCVLGVILLALIVWLFFLDGSATAVQSSAAYGDNYERVVLAGRKKEVPVYCVERTDKAIALTIDAAFAAARLW